MREVQKQQMDLGAIADELDLKSRDDIPRFSWVCNLYSNQETRTALFSLLEEHIGPGRARGTSGDGVVAHSGYGCLEAGSWL